MKLTIERNWIEVIGTIWMPAATCAQRIDLTRYDIENIGEPTRDNVELWLTMHSGDFQHVQDFRAIVGETVIDWNNPDSEFTYNDCMFPELEPA